MTLNGFDYAGGRPTAQQIKAAGGAFVCRYLSDGGPGLPGKLLLPGEASALRAGGVDIVSNWETTADRMLGGFNAGVADAQAARDQVVACGGPAGGGPIYFSADFDATPDQQGPINDYLRGAASVIGAANVGVYGGYWVVSRALDAGVARWAWQCQAWSGGNVDARAHILQDNNAGYAYVGGVQCDIDHALQADYGQWSAHMNISPSTPTGGPVAQPGDDQPLKQGYFRDFESGFNGAIGSDVKDIREQLTGGRDLVKNPDGTVDIAKSFPGWPQLGGRTLVDAIAVIGAHLGIPGFTDPKAGK